MVVNGFLLNSVSSLTTILADELLLKTSFCIFFDSKGKLFFFLTKKKMQTDWQCDFEQWGNVYKE